MFVFAHSCTYSRKRRGIIMAMSIIFRDIAKLCGLALVVSLPLVGSEVLAEEELIGSDEFRISCASCHGVGGRGNGKVAQILNVKPADLTMVAKNNGGKYPFQKILQMIDGRAIVSGHGDRAMPVWGSRYLEEEAERYGLFGGEEVVRARILELVYYIQQIQQE